MSVIPQASKNYVGFDPRSIPGCALWLDAADLSSFTPSYPTNGTAISQWNDKSGNSRHATQATTNNRPVYSSSDVSIDTTTNPRFFNLASMPTSPYDIFIVAKPVSSNTDWRTLFRTNTAEPGMNPIVLQAGTNNLGYWTSTAFSQFGSYTWSPSTRNLFFARMNSNKTINASLNGDLSLTSATSAGSASDVILYMGALVNNGSVSQQWGNINEVIFYNSALTTSQRQQIEGYLANKWGLRTNLPASHPYKTIPIFSRPFQPTDITNCRLWLDGADSSTLTLSGSNVTQWNDKSGNGRNATQATTARQPTYANGTLSFTNAGQKFLSLPTNSLFPGNSSTSLIMVMSPTSTYNVNVFLFQGVVSTNNAIGIYTTGTTFADYWQASGGSTWGSMTANTRYIMNYTFNVGSTTLFTFLNGTGGTFRAQGSYTVTASNATIGAEVERGFYADVNINEIIIYDFVLSETQRQIVEGYLANKWGLRGSIPSNQPFKLFAPITPIFTPLNISGCSLWLDGADPNGNGVIPSNGSLIATWTDKSGNGRNATATNPASLASNSLNNQPTLYFDGTLSRIYSGSISITGSTVYAFVVFVSAMNSGSEGIRLLSFSASGVADWNSNSTGIMFLYDTNRIQTFRNSVTTTNLTCPAVGTPFISTTYYNNSIAYNNLNGGASLSATAFSGSFNATGYISGSGNVNIKGNLAEILIYNTSLNDSQRQQVEGYLASKWGLKNSLPSSHPFKVITP